MDAAIVSHKNCPDGSAAVLFARIIRPEIQYYFSNHDEINDTCLRVAEQVNPNGTLWITDIICDQKVLGEIFEILHPKNVRLAIYEHHVSREWVDDILPPPGMQLKVIFDKKRCGSKIFYDEHKGENPRLKKYKGISDAINDRDLWINKNEKGAVLARLHQIYDDQLFMERLMINPSFKLQEKERVLFEYQYRQEEKRIRELLGGIEIKKDKQGFRYGVIYGHGTSSDVLDRALHEKDLEYVLLLNLNDKRAHIRSRGKFNCAEFSVQQGGGGHPCAGGFPLYFNEPRF